MWRELGKRVAVLVITIVVVVAVAAAGPMLLQAGDEGSDAPANPEYDPATVAPDPIEATGEIEADPAADADGSGTVLIDRGHSNRFTRTDIEPIVDALVQQGYDVEFYNSGNLSSNLEDVDAFLVIDPGEEYLTGDIEEVRKFTGNGGRLVMIGEPDRTAISTGLLGASITTQESQLTTLASRYGMSIDTQYLYNQEHADGTFKHVLARPTGAGGAGDADRLAMYTAAAVTTDDGTVLVRSAPNTHKSGTDGQSGEYPVAVRSNNALLVGDKTFMRSDRYNVADNEEFLAYLVEFMIEGDQKGSSAETASNSGSDSEPGPTSPSTSAATPGE
ncbi:Gldg family protein [Haloplanus sp.]|uniref:Gldg family protein n=1 Tax=Haloplanus sp. TaxID=1961696 RepID=UPI002602C92A|nr:DUF4350 domain-containing protein [Haloplanus sp.]